MNRSEIYGRFSVVNVGETKAVLTKLHSELFVATGMSPVPALPAIPPYEGKLGEILADKNLDPGQSLVFQFPSGGPMQSDYDTFAAVERTARNPAERGPAGESFTWLIGWTEYKDSTGRIRKTGFARRYNDLTKRFEQETDRDYEYDD